MNLKLIVIVTFFLISQSGYCQFSYKELYSYLEKTNYEADESISLKGFIMNSQQTDENGLNTISWSKGDMRLAMLIKGNRRVITYMTPTYAEYSQIISEVKAKKFQRYEIEKPMDNSVSIGFTDGIGMEIVFSKSVVDKLPIYFITITYKSL